MKKLKIIPLPDKYCWKEKHHDYNILYHAMLDKKDKHGNPVGGKTVFIGRHKLRERNKYAK